MMILKLLAAVDIIVVFILTMAILANIAMGDMSLVAAEGAGLAVAAAVLVALLAAIRKKNREIEEAEREKNRRRYSSK